MFSHDVRAVYHFGAEFICGRSAQHDFAAGKRVTEKVLDSRHMCLQSSEGRPTTGISH